MTEAVTRSDLRQAAVKHSVKVRALAQLTLEIGVSEALKVIGAAMDRTPREIAASARRAYREMIIAEIVRFENQGRRRDAVSLVVDDRVADRNDPVEVEILKDKFRRWRRAEEKRANARLQSTKSDTG
jgi:hypothetical protein